MPAAIRVLAVVPLRCVKKAAPDAPAHLFLHPATCKLHGQCTADGGATKAATSSHGLHEVFYIWNFGSSNKTGFTSPQLVGFFVDD